MIEPNPYVPAPSPPHGAGEESVDPYWYKRAVFYEVLVRGFNDSNGDGTGDLRGLIEKLDYLQWLGVDCVWLLPIYTSPLRDGGYDISDYTSIQPEFGELGDFVALVNEAHQRGIRVIADLVVNHTSDQHPWFQASRSDPTGPYGDFYVWADTDEGFPDARIIFTDTEKSNWTYDSVRGQYYFHRFFYHQPDLELRQPRAAGGGAGGRPVLARPRHRRVPAGRHPLPVRPGGHQLREPAGDPRVPEAAARGDRHEIRRPGAARGGEPVAGRRRRIISATTSPAGTNATWPSTSR